MRHAGPLLVLVALTAEIAAWVLGAVNRTESFAFFRVQAHLGAGGFVLAAIAGLVAMALPRLRTRHPYVTLALAALVLHGVFLDLPQGQPDTVTWFTLAQGVAHDPAVLLDWPATAWGTEEARFHKPLPLVPAVYGLAYALFGESPATTDGVLTLWALALPLVVAWAGADKGRPAVLAGLVAATVPLVAAQQAWMLADLPLCVLVTFAWGWMARAHGPAGWALAALACVPALLTKVSAGLFLAGPAAALLLRGKPGGVWIAGAIAYASLALVLPPRVRDPATWVAALGAIALHLRPTLWVLARRADPLTLGAIGVIPALVMWSPAEHAARYAMPLAPALALCAARLAPRLAAFAVASGLVLLLGGYRPIVVHHQAKNVQVATRALVARGATAIEVWTDMPDNTFPPDGVAALVDFYAPVPVRTAQALASGKPDRKRHWWEFTTTPPWRGPGPADAALLGLFGADDRRFRATQTDWREAERVSLYQASSLLLPREVVTYGH